MIDEVDTLQGDDSISDAMLRDSAAVSVIGRSANSTGDPADIAAGANDRVLVRESDALSFSQVSDAMLASSYALLLGRSGGQSVLGGTGSGDDLTLNSTSNGTKGYVLLATQSATEFVGVGVAVPGRKFQVEADASGYAASFFNDGNDANRKGVYIQCGQDAAAANPSATFLDFYEGDGDLTGAISADNTGVVALSSSDIRRKTDIAPTGIDALAVIRGLEIIEFCRVKRDGDGVVTWKGEKVAAGFSAQNVQAVFPPAAAPMSDGSLAVGAANLIPVLIKATQEQQAIIQALEARVRSLEQRAP